MITKECIKLAEIVQFEDRTFAGDLILSNLALNDKYRKVLDINNTIIDIETGKEILEAPSVSSKQARLYTKYYSVIAPLDYVVNEDITKAIEAYDIYLQELNDSKIVQFKTKQRKRHI